SAQSSHLLAMSLRTTSFRSSCTGVGFWSTRTASLFRTRGIPPKRATSGFLPPPRTRVASRHFLGPCGVWTMVWKRFAIVWVVVRYFAASVWVKDCWTIHLYPLNQDTLMASK